MAINFSSQDASAQAFSAAAPAQPKAPPTLTDVEDLSMYTVNPDMMFGSPLTATMNPETYVKAKEKMLEALKTVAPNYEIALLDLDASVLPSLQYACFLLCANIKGNASSISYHVLLLEETGEDISPTQEIMNTAQGSVQYKIYYPASAAVNNILMNAAKAVMDRAYPTSNLFSTSATVLPRDLNLLDVTNIKKIAHHVGKLLAAKLLSTHPYFKDVNVPEWCYSENKLKRQFVISQNAGQMEPTPQDILGRHYRSDCRVAFETPSVNGKKRTQLNETNVRSQVTVSHSYVEPVWVRQARNSLVPVPYNPEEKAVMPRVVITNIESNQGSSPGQLMLAIYATAAANSNHAWRAALRPSVRKNPNALDIRDLGYLNVIVNLGDPGTKPGNHISDVASSPQVMAEYISAVFTPNVALAIDYIEGSKNAPEIQFLLQAALGDRSAIRLVHETVNRMTNGAFSKLYTPEMPIFATAPESFMAGTWTDASSQVRDIRDIDLTAVCAINHKNPIYIWDWINAEYNTGIEQSLRISQKVDMLRQYTGDTFRITGKGARITFSAGFVMAWMRAMVESCGTAVQLNNANAQDMGTMIYNASFANAAAFGGTSGLSTYGNYYNGAVNAGVNANFGYYR